MKLAVVSHSAVIPRYRRKWRLMADKKGWEVHLIIPAAWPEGGFSGPARPGQEGRLHVHVLPAWLRGHVGFFTYRGLGRLITSLKPDMVFAEEEPYSLSCLQTLAAAKKAGATFGFFTWENMARRYKPPLNLVLKHVLGWANLAVAGNSEGLGLLKARGFRGRLAMLPQYGVDTELFRPVRLILSKALRLGRLRLPRSGPTLRVGYMGRLVKEKGIDLLIKACAGLPMELAVAGSGPEMGRLKALAQARGVRLSMAGFIPYEKAPAWLAGLDCLCLPSRTTHIWKEQFGRVLAEAMACGVPCLGSDSGAIPEVIGHGGLIFKEGDVADLRNKLKKLAGSPPLRKRLGKAARRWAVKEYDEKKLVDKLAKNLNFLKT